MANTNKSCIQCQEELDKCKQSSCKKCEETKRDSVTTIKGLEKKIMTLTIVIAITLTLVGKEIADKVFSSFENIQKIEKLNIEESETSNTSNKTDVVPSLTFPSE